MAHRRSDHPSAIGWSVSMADGPVGTQSMSGQPGRRSEAMYEANEIIVQGVIDDPLVRRLDAVVAQVLERQQPGLDVLSW